MNKLYSLLTATVICSAASGLFASEGRDRSNFFYDPKIDSLKSFFDQKTQDVVKKTAKNYAYGYAGLYVVGALGVRLFEASSMNLLMSRGGSSALNLIKELSPITHSIPVTLPLVVGGMLVHHKYQENLREKNAA